MPVALLAVALLSTPCAALAQGDTASSAPELARMIDQLAPGQWVWAPEVAPEGPVLVYVDLSRQVAVVYRNGVRIGATTVSSGKPGHSTPTGVFTILQKDAKHRSRKYNNAPMPFQQRLTWDGVALHAGGLPGYPESHGCVHLPYEFARQLFAITHLGITVVVQGNAESPVTTTPNTLLSPFDEAGLPADHQPLAPGERYRWRPEVAAAQGPLSIIVSKTDQRVVVLRGGQEVGRSVARLDDPDPGSHVVTLIERDGRPHWVYVGIAGHADDDGVEAGAGIIDQVALPGPFYRELQPLLLPGTTILLTNSRVGARQLEQLTIMDAVSSAP